MRSYNWDADDYAASSSEQQKWARELIDKLDLRGDEQLLDIGCGDGKVTAEIAGILRDGQTVGVDSSSEMIALARERHAEVSNLAFQVADARELPFDARFDVLFSNAALHWVRDHGPVLIGIARSLKADGRILLQMGGKGNAAEILSVLDEMIASEQWQPHFIGFEFPYGFHGDEEYRVWFMNAGLDPSRVELIPKDMAHQGQEGLAGWIRTTLLPYTQRVPEADRERFVSELADWYLERHPVDGNGLAHVAMMRLEVEATRG